MSDSRRLVAMSVAPSLLAESLGMPADCEIVGAEFDVQHGTIRLIVRSQQFEPIPVGVAPFTVAPTIHVTPERRVWDWNLGK